MARSKGTDAQAKSKRSRKRKSRTEVSSDSESDSDGEMSEVKNNAKRVRSIESVPDTPAPTEKDKKRMHKKEKREEKEKKKGKKEGKKKQKRETSSKSDGADREENLDAISNPDVTTNDAQVESFPQSANGGSPHKSEESFVASPNTTRASVMTTQTAETESTKATERKDDEAVDKEFSAWYLKQITGELADDLDKVRNAKDFTERSVPIMVAALQSGHTIFSIEEKRRILGIKG